MTTLTDRCGNALAISGCGRCSSCNTIKPRAEFYKDRGRSTGISSRCRECERKRFRNKTARALTNDLRELMARYPTYRPLIEGMAATIAA